MQAEDRQLITAFQAGDPEAFDTLFRLYAGRVLAFARGLTPNQADAEDLTQEVFVAAHRGAEGFQMRCSLLGWLFSIAVRRQRDRQRRRTVEVPFPADEQRGAPNDTANSHRDCDGMADRIVTSVTLRAALDDLDPTLREAFLLVAVQGLTHREAAAILDRPLGTIKWRVAEAARRLRHLLSDEPERKTDHVPTLCL